MSQTDFDLEEKTSSTTRERLQEPPMYRVLLHNDDYPTMDFVVQILKLVFHKSTEAAVRIMLDVHQQGIGVCGIYKYAVAETKVDMVHQLARQHGFPLRFSMEKDLG